MSASPFSLLSIIAVNLACLAGVFPAAEGQYSQEEAEEGTGVLRGADGDLYGVLERKQPELSWKEDSCSSPLKDPIKRIKAVGHDHPR